MYYVSDDKIILLANIVNIPNTNIICAIHMYHVTQDLYNYFAYTHNKRMVHSDQLLQTFYYAKIVL